MSRSNRQGFCFNEEYLSHIPALQAMCHSARSRNLTSHPGERMSMHPAEKTQHSESYGLIPWMLRTPQAWPEKKMRPE